MIHFAGAVTKNRENDEAIGAAMAKALAGTPQHLTCGHLQMVWSGDGHGGITQHAEAGIIVALQGAPWLAENHLDAVARRQGVPVALAEGYRTHGEKLLESIKGHFAVAFIDTETPRVLVATDRFAARRAHVAVLDDRILFGTALNPISAAHSRLSEVSLEAIYRYLYFYAIPSPFTAYTNISRLEPGHAYVWSPEGSHTIRYWAPTFQADRGYKFETAKAGMLDALEAAVKRACQTGGTCGAFLSGGLDSSAVAGMMARQERSPCFHVSFDSDTFDESAYAKLAADWFQLPLYDIQLTPQDAFDILSDLSRHLDEPFGNSSAIPTTLCARLARDHGVTTMIAGDGGDELFAGNERYIRQKKIATWQHRVPAWIRHTLAHLPGPVQRSSLRRIVRASQLANCSIGERILEGTAVLNANPRDVLHPEIADAVRSNGPVEDLEAYAEACPDENWLRQLLYIDMKYTLADNDLRKVGAACELAGVEVAYPMLDEAVVEMALSVPPDDLIQGFRLRHFYKEAVTGFLPEAIINKKKQGFGMPFANWLVEDSQFRTLADDALASLNRRRLLAPDYLERTRAALAGREDQSAISGAWDLIVLELWLTEHQAQLPG